MKSKILAWLAIALILATGILHFVTAAQEYGEARYMGVLFLANFIGALVSAIGIFRQKAWSGWGLGTFVTVGSILGYLLSRTTGMPGMEVDQWYDPIGIPALIVEGSFLVVFVLAKPWRASGSEGAILSIGNGKNRQPMFVTAAMLVVIAAGFFYQLGARSSGDADDHPLPERIISVQTLEEEYGIRMMLVAVTAAGGLVDVRYRIINPDKAVGLMEDGAIMPMVYVEENDVMLMPDSHMRTQKLIADRMYFELIPNTQNAIQRGTTVTVAFGDVALEPIVAK